MRMLVAPLRALTDSRLTDPERRVLLSLYSFLGKDSDTVWPSMASVAERANIEDCTRISKLTTSLSKKGWLTKKRRGFTGGNEYKLIPLEDSPKLVSQSNLDAESNLDSQTLSKLVSQSNLDSQSKLASDTQPKLACESKYKELTNELTNIKTPLPPVDVTSTASTSITAPTSKTPAWFDRYADRLWKTYPKKRDKKQSIDRLRKLAAKKNSRPQLAEILNHIRLRRRVHPDGQYWPTLDRMIRQEKYRDEIPGLGMAPKRIVDIYHRVLPGNPEYTELTPADCENLGRLWDRLGRTDQRLTDYFKHCATQGYLIGQGRDQWKASFSFLINPDKFSAICGGETYTDKD